MLVFIAAVLLGVVFVLYFSSGSDGDKNQPINAYSSARREVEILRDCMELVNTSHNVKTVYYRYFELIESIDRLLQYQKEELDGAGINIISDLPAKRQEILDKADAIFNAAIDRQFQKEIENASKLKTNKGKINRINKFVNSLSEYPMLPPESLEYAKELRDNFQP